MISKCISGFRTLAAAATVLVITALAAAADNLSPLGVWLGVSDDGEKGHVQIHECGRKLCGKLVWNTQPDANDINNPDEALRSRRVIGLTILWDLEPDGENFWDYGRLYDPTTGKTWRCNIRVLPGGDRLRIRGYLGISLLGQSRIWTRVR